MVFWLVAGGGQGTLVVIMTNHGAKVYDSKVRWLGGAVVQLP